MTTTPPTDQQLAQRIAAAIASVVVTIGPNSLALLKAGHTLGLTGGEVDAMALSALAVVRPELDRLAAALAEYESAITWHTECLSCARVLDSSIKEYERAEKAEADLARVSDELAELKASNNPRLRCLLVKVAPDRDLYVGWSNVCEMPAGAWTRAEALAYGFPASRLDRVAKTGTSSHIGDGRWGSSGFVAEQRGFLRRDRLGDYATAYLAGDLEAAFALLEPFEDDDEEAL